VNINVYRPTKTFVQKHKTALAVTATVIVCAAISKAGMKQHDDFLKEHDLYDTFYDQID
jgi:hypothetical protein